MIENKSGLKWELVKVGNGEKPIPGQKVSIHYDIWFGTGTTTSNFDYDNNEYVDVMHDSTRDERDPFSGPVEFEIGTRTPDDDVYKKGHSIAGLDEALLDMRVGGKRKISIPSKLAYGKLGGSSFHTFHGYRVPPDCPLDMEIELVDIIGEKSD